MGCWTPPFGNPQVSLRYPDWPNSSPLRGWSFGAVGESASACALATAAAPPPLRGGGFAPLPPKVPHWGKFADHARTRMVPRPKRLLRQRLRKSNAEAPAAQRRGVRLAPSRELRPKAAPARPPGGIPKGAQPSLASLCLLSAGQIVGARRGLSASKGKIKNYENVKKIKNPFPSNQKEKGVKGGRLSPPKTRKHTLRCAFLRRSTKFAILCRGEINRTDRVAASFFHPRKKGVMRKWIRIK